MNCFQITFLNTQDLNDIGESNNVMKKKFLGAYPADSFPPFLSKKECGWIWNTDEKHLPGQHWVAIYKYKKILYFFDSYGYSPKFYQKPYWKVKNHRFVNISKHIQLQSNSTSTCGAWCLLFLYYCFRHKTFPYRLFSSSNQMKNEQILFRLIMKIFKQKINKPIQQSCKHNQCCTSKNLN